MLQTDDFQNLQAVIKKFCEERDWDQFHTPKDLSIGLSTEAAEVLELFRFKSEAEVNELIQRPEFTQKLGFELADVLFFLLRISEKTQVNLKKSFEEKMKLNAEKYPIEKSKGSNKKYTEL
jgi:NTP pyrophosphatase (non-canonical NTP hydrolase)